MPLALARVGQAGDADAERQEALVDVVGLDKCLPFGASAAHSLAARQVDKTDGAMPLNDCAAEEGAVADVGRLKKGVRRCYTNTSVQDDE